MEVEAELGSVPIPVRTGVNRRETFFKQDRAKGYIVFRTELTRSEFSEVIVSYLSDKGWTQMDGERFCGAKVVVSDARTIGSQYAEAARTPASAKTTCNPSAPGRIRRSTERTR